MVEGFLGRWSQRKQALRAGKVLREATLPVAAPAPIVADVAVVDLSAAQPPAQAPEQPTPLSLDDVKSLTAESNFAPFAAREVAPEVRNAAMKKLFTDPHYNVMDRLDIYIDDYSQADPLPESMLRQMASAKFLKLFAHEDQEHAESPDRPELCAADRTAADHPVSQSATGQNVPEADVEHAPGAVSEPAPADLPVIEDK